MLNHVIKKCFVKPLEAKLIQPFRTALGQHDSLENLAFVVELADGTKGFGEAAIATHITGETLLMTKSHLEDIAKDLVGQNIDSYILISAYLNERFSKNKCAVAAVEMALLDALTQQLNVPLWKFFGTTSTKLVSDITIVINSVEETAFSAKQFYRQGFRSFKVKIGRDVDLDLKRVAVVKKITRNSPIILDANQGYTADQTLKFLDELKRLGVRPKLIEQPVPKEDWEGLKRVSKLSQVPVCADESAGSLADVIRIIREKAAPVINIKLMKFGLLQAREAANLARSAGIKLMIGGMMESPLAMTAAAHLAVGMGCFQYVDLDTPFFIKPVARIGGLRQVTYLNSKGIYDLSKVKSGMGLIPALSSSKSSVGDS
ncbi:MAG: dipeptide epimerase [Candidatus Omnitrophica bacterium]|nr:dipeptide epimerase [Candidatus Omnitrophota bacterium]